MFRYPDKTFQSATIISFVGTIIFFLMLMLFFTEGLKPNPNFDISMGGPDTPEKALVMEKFMVPMSGPEVLLQHVTDPALILNQSTMLGGVFIIIFICCISIIRAVSSPGKP